MQDFSGVMRGLGDQVFLSKVEIFFEEQRYGRTAGKNSNHNRCIGPKGIGRATAFRLAQQGANVIVADLIDPVKIGDIGYARMDLLGEVCSEIEEGVGHLRTPDPEQLRRFAIAICV